MIGARQTVTGPDLDMIYGGRVQPGQVGAKGEPSRHGTLVACLVETYTPVVLGSDPLSAPELLLNSTPF